MIVKDQVTPVLKKLSRLQLKRLKHDIAHTLIESAQQRQREQKDIHGSKLKKRAPTRPENDYQRLRQHQPLFPFLFRDENLKVAFDNERLSVGFTGRNARYMQRNNAGVDAPKREIFGFSERDLKMIDQIIEDLLKRSS